MLKPETLQLIETLKLTGLIGTIIAIFRHIIEERLGGWLSLLRGFLASIVVAVIVGLLLGETTLQELTKAAVIGITAYVADDILFGLRKITVAIRNDPLGSIKELFAIWKGR
jgi:hypothetical protein